MEESQSVPASAVYVDCFSGASGDMLLGALVDAGVDPVALRETLASLPVSGWSLRAERTSVQGIAGTRMHVDVDPSAPQPTRTLAEVEAVVRGGRLPEVVRERALAVFRRLAEAEARVHGTGVDAVHFHEVGAVDALVDVVGVTLGLHLLGATPERTLCSGLPLGNGWVRGEHGRLPVPAPATLELLRLAGAPTRRTPPVEDDTPIGELTTPTGAALLTTLARFQEPRVERIERVGYGFGTRVLPWPNAVRLWVGQAEGGIGADGLRRDTVVQIETNLDDTTPEQLGFAMERLFEAGALDVAFSPLQMKKNRPGVLLRVLGRPGAARELAGLVMRHTTALGVRVEHVERLIAVRGERTVATPWGDVRVKEKRLAGETLLAPEYEDCAARARAAGVTLAEVYEAARRAAGG